MEKIRLLRRGVSSMLVSLCLSGMLTACGDNIKGEYVATNGSGLVANFKSGGIVEMVGQTFPFEVKGKAITVKEGNGKEEVFIINDDGTLQIDTPFGPLTLKKK